MKNSVKAWFSALASAYKSLGDSSTAEIWKNFNGPSKVTEDDNNEKKEEKSDTKDSAKTKTSDPKSTDESSTSKDSSSKKRRLQAVETTSVSELSQDEKGVDLSTYSDTGMPNISLQGNQQTVSSSNLIKMSTFLLALIILIIN